MDGLLHDGPEGQLRRLAKTYTLTDLGGTAAAVVADPVNRANQVDRPITPTSAVQWSWPSGGDPHLPPR